ncbi:MAG: Fe-S-cluster-containing hydrogenase [Bacteroidales bacterium]|nr:Fe-S-cluster-containing hydrogenase [Bacteroidales bacterium]MCF8458154.1 Fe-S-cluster-containing hydrogenase [Bacteroidales bacterium]
MKKYWRSIDEYKTLQKDLTLAGDGGQEFSIDGMSDEEVKGNTSRRDFLKMFGFSIGFATIATSCETPVRKAIPYLIQPEEITPGIANHYASTFYDGHDYCSILIKTREGRPIKIEGNELSPISKGATNARVQASVLNLYDNARLKAPHKDGSPSDWAHVDAEIIPALDKASADGKEIVLLTSTIISPSTKQIIKDFKDKFGNVTWLTYDAISMQAMRKANEKNFGEAFIPTYDLTNAKLVVGFNADFLGTWMSPTEYTKQYSAARKLLNGESAMLRHVQYESQYTITGGAADDRVPIKPSDEVVVLLNIYNYLAAKLSQPVYPVADTSIEFASYAEELLENQGQSIVFSGTNNLNIQLICNAINHLLGNYNQTIDLSKHYNLKQGDDQAIDQLISKIDAGNVGAVIHYNVNPAYDAPNAEAYKTALAKVELSISMADAMNETAALCKYVCPDNNYLESWNDAEPQTGVYSTQQPTIRNLFDTRQAQESFLRWMGNAQEYHDYMEAFWQANIFPLQSTFTGFIFFWNQCIHDGVFAVDAEKKDFQFTSGELKAPAFIDSGDFELVLYEKIGLGDGKYANNPWLQELPDPVTTATWDNYVCVPAKYAEENGLKLEDVVRVNDLFELPIVVQPGLAYGTVAIALGYGRTSAGKVADGLGQNAFPLLSTANGLKSLMGSKVSIERVAGKTYPLALTQEHHTMEGRDLIRETTLSKFLADPASGNEQHAKDAEVNANLYDEPKFTGFHWGMAINLNSCTGCGNCVISCQAENNVAVIGKEQVKNRRIMHWIRIDRYYSEDHENPEVLHQPLMCQHCDNAPCENVCPVAATPHSSEGLNQMAYNRCIGTRYCMNNCPYRVRRFNWFEFANNKKFDFNSSMSTDLGKLVLNPDVVVRSRGVVEKCSLCVQRIQEKKLLAKTEGRQLQDGEIKTACQQSCPGDAIVFGDLLDPNSKISEIQRNPRMYHLLEHVHTLPSTSYLTKIRNKKS